MEPPTAAEVAAPIILLRLPLLRAAHRPGAGGQRKPLPASQGQLPSQAKVFTMPPAARPMEAELILPPAIDAPAPEPVAELRWGDPRGAKGPASSGPGGPAGIGNERGRSVGNDGGPGDGSASPRVPVYWISGEVSAPKLIHKMDPEYSEEARKAKVQGTVRMEIAVGEDGRVGEIRVTGPLGLGQDERAVEAVRRWRFRPGMRMGRPVPVRATVEVNFRLL